jgi:hypothetical protein
MAALIIDSISWASIGIPVFSNLASNRIAAAWPERSNLARTPF